jgi:hypothetical protein
MTLRGPHYPRPVEALARSAEDVAVAARRDGRDAPLLAKSLTDVAKSIVEIPSRRPTGREGTRCASSLAG